MADDADDQSPQESASALELSTSISIRMWYLRSILAIIYVLPTIGSADYLTIDDLYLVNVLLVDVAHLWKEVGLALHLKTPTLERIRESGDMRVVRCFTDMLAAWLNREDRPHDPSWGEAIAAIKLVNGICYNFLPDCWFTGRHKMWSP